MPGVSWAALVDANGGGARYRGHEGEGIARSDDAYAAAACPDDDTRTGADVSYADVRAARGSIDGSHTHGRAGEVPRGEVARPSTRLLPAYRAMRARVRAAQRLSSTLCCRTSRWPSASRSQPPRRRRSSAFRCHTRSAANREARLLAVWRLTCFAQRRESIARFASYRETHSQNASVRRRVET